MGLTLAGFPHVEWSLSAVYLDVRASDFGGSGRTLLVLFTSALLVTLEMSAFGVSFRFLADDCRTLCLNFTPWQPMKPLHETWRIRLYHRMALYRRFYRAMLCIRGTSHGPVSVCPSVCPSQVGVLLKRLNVGSHKQHHTIAQGL